MTKSGQNAVTTLRQMILTGALKTGERLVEIATSERLGVSRTPVRIAFRTLEQEGLLTKLPRRGYEVRSVSPIEIEGAIEVRGVLEGLAARQAAENGLNEEQKNEMQSLLTCGDLLFEGAELTEDDLATYHDMNRRFHLLIIEASGNLAIQAALSKNEHLPFASVSALAIDKNNMQKEFKRFAFAHQQHHHVFHAMLSRQGARAEGIMREHAQATLGYDRNYHRTELKNILTVISHANK
ncbi:GntR family transcriptional regulator [Pseudoalteromonas sp. SG43-1]|jgi:GntR family transcriptional regulator of vanillate catabolism|uniref:GntR family transcriptional regulator n=1 Tax=unclassified Pseudoalteromonas TaxID=194690 RepID=UPI0016000EAA|nr:MULTISPECIES: GntR family transcriptional regulator [unclassified Pseudoalteromonas]MBB1444258.1 GntR family transcriptional regulator [Pseudoalteromonas sp. SG43-3]MBB1450673.1 GntR family transcriptional regulator [Pseudoalteromonas sp. SG43-1]|tara:strand:- start:782 stop:1498 length:717 start_codon:yes stop_codon:yes gene_type:complete